MESRDNGHAVQADRADQAEAVLRYSHLPVSSIEHNVKSLDPPRWSSRPKDSLLSGIGALYRFVCDSNFTLAGG